MTKVFLENKITEVLLNFEPRIDLNSVRVDDDQDNNRLIVDIYFYVVGVPGPQTVQTFLQSKDNMANGKLVVSDLDFTDIKDNLKKFLQSQTQFQDYDFEGSSLSILLDILSYNTHYMAYLANMSTNELYLDSADIRNNIVSLAKMLGYTPNSPHTKAFS